MFRLLIRLFVKDDSRQKYGILAGITGIVVNVMLFVVKLFIGSATVSISITADAFNNFNDAVSSVISIFGFKLSMRAPDKEHPFGHGRSEYIAGLLVSFLMLIVGVEFLKSSILRILNPVATLYDNYMLLILVISVLLKLWMWSYNRYAGKIINSPTLFATAADSFNDAIITFTTIISMVLSRYIFIDGYLGLLISAFILYGGIKSLGETLSPLLGEAADALTVEKIENLLTQYEGIIGVHDFVLHNYGNGKKMATIHAEVPNDSNIVTIHNMVDEAEHRIFSEFGIFIVVHVDPVPINDEETNKAKKSVENVISIIDKSLKIHDFRLVERDLCKNLIFDLVIPYSYTESDKKSLLQKITDTIKDENPKYTPIITPDYKM